MVESVGKRLTGESDVVGSIYDAALNLSLWPLVAKKITEYVGSHQSIIIMSGAQSPIVSEVVSFGVNPEIHEHYKEIIKEDVWLNGMIMLPSRTTCIGSQFMPTNKFIKTRMYNQLCKPSDVMYMAGGVAINDGENFLCIGCHTNRSVGQLGREALHRIRYLLRHIERSVFIHRRISEVDCRKSEMEETLNFSKFGVIFLSAKNRILWCNNMARKIFSKKDGVSCSHSHLRFGSNEARNKFLTAEQGLLDKIPSQTVHDEMFFKVNRKVSSQPYLVTVCIVSSEAMKVNCGATFVVFIIDPDHPPTVSANALKCFYDLTKAEIKICIQLMANKSLAEIADLFQVSKNTVRCQLKSIFGKCDVHSQAQLILKLNNCSFTKN